MPGNDAKTVLLIQSDTTSGSTIFEDSSIGGEQFIVSTGGTPAQHTSYNAKFGATCMYMDWNAHLRINPPSSGNCFEFVGDYTIDFWFNGNIGSNTRQFMLYSNGAYPKMILEADQYNSSYSIRQYTPDGTLFMPLTAEYEWHHFAIVRYNGVIYFYRDGKLADSLPYTPTLINEFYTYIMGAYYIGLESVPGWYEEYRVSYEARWKGEFRPPPVPYSEVTDSGNNANTVLLIHSGDPDGSTSFLDNSTGGETHIISPLGQTHHSTAQAMFGGSSILLDGVGDGLSIPPSADFVFGAGDFTIDFWIYSLSIASTSSIIFAGGDANENAISIETVNSAISFYFVVKVNGTVMLDTTAAKAIPYDTWHHIALVREAGTLTLYVYGIADATAFMPTSLVSSTGVEIAPVQYSGYVDEFRISNVAVWSSDFIPYYAPYAELPLFASVIAPIGLGASTEIEAPQGITTVGASIGLSNVMKAYGLQSVEVVTSIGLQATVEAYGAVEAEVNNAIGLQVAVTGGAIMPALIEAPIGLASSMRLTSERELELPSTIGLKAIVKGVAYDPPYPTELAVTIGLGAELDASHKDKLADISCNIGLGSTLRVLKLPEAELSTGIGLHAVCEADIGKALFVTCGIGLASSILAKADRPFTIECAVGLGSTVSMVKDADTSLPVSIGLGSNVKISSDAVQQSCALPEFEDRWI